MDQVEEVKNKVDIVQLIGEYVQLKRAGRNFKGLCPFHGEKTPSFMVNPELQIFKCFGCAAGGDAYSFLEKIEGMDFGEALQNLAKRAGVTLASYRPSPGEESRQKLIEIQSLAAEAYHFVLTKHPAGKRVREYVKSRGISDEAVETFKLGYAPKGWDFLMKFLVEKKGYKPEELEQAGLVIKAQRYYDRFRDRVMFPLNNARGQTVGFAGRVMPGADEKAGGKYVNTPETEIYHKGQLLYGLDKVRSEIKLAGWAVVVEGEIDSIASYQAGVKNVVAIKGSALTEKQVEVLRRISDTVVLGLDADIAGDAAARRGIAMADKAGLAVKIVDAQSEKVNPQKFKDPGEWAIKDAQGWKKAVDQAIPIYDFFIESAVKRYGLDISGKKRIGQELLPIWSEIADEIVKAHYIKKLADVLGVGEDDIRKQMGKANVKNEVRSTNTEVKNEKTEAREVREGRVVQMAILGGKIGELKKEPIRGWMKTEFWKRVAEELKPGEIIKEAVNSLPAELGEKVKELMLGEEEFAEKGWEEAKSLLEMAEIEGQLKSETDLQKVDKWVKRKAELTKSK